MSEPGGGVVLPPGQDPVTQERTPSCLVSQLRLPPSAPPAPGQARPLTLPEAATYLNVTERYMRRLVTERRIPYFKVGRLLRFSTEDLDDFLEASRIETGEAHPLLPPRRPR
jgi:excisionase family DNA binding protein